MDRCRRRVTFNKNISLRYIPNRRDLRDDVDTAGKCLSLSLRDAVVYVNKVISGGCDVGYVGDDVITRMVVSSYTEALSKSIYETSSVQFVKSNRAIEDIVYDDSGLHDKIILDFANSIVKGVSGRVWTEEQCVENTLFLLIDPSPDDLVQKMEYGVVFRTLGYRKGKNVSAMTLIIDRFLN